MSALEASAKIAQAHSQQAVLVEPGRIELRDYIAPRPGPGELLIEIRCALSCGTDLKTFRRGHPMWPMPTPFGKSAACSTFPRASDVAASDAVRP